MKVIVDDKIPYIKETLKSFGVEALYIPGSKFTNEIVKDADALIIRTRTYCNEELLHDSKVKFIATATIGFDHIDREYCKNVGIKWVNCPGCNSGAVEQYIHSSLLLLEKERGLILKDAILGIVGVGHVGTRVANVAKSLGMKVLLNDPPRKDNGKKGFVDLNELVENCDVITFHVPLIKDGKYKTYHLADESFFSSLMKKPFIINTSRGDVIKTEALVSAIKSKDINDAIIDVWEHEPNIDLDLLKSVFIGTQHIAGYSADGKANATRESLKQLSEFFNINIPFRIELPQYTLKEDKSYYYKDYNYLQIYNPHNDSIILKDNPSDFEKLRGDYELRREI